MLRPVTAQNLAAFEAACAHERVFGSKCLSFYQAYRESGEARFWVDLGPDGSANSALFLLGGVLVVSSNNRTDPAELAGLVRGCGVCEVDTNWDQCAALQKLLGGRAESSFYMEYPGGPIGGDYAGVTGAFRLPEVYAILRRSHEYYRAHLEYEPWARDLSLRLSLGLCELYQLNVDGVPAGTGSIASEDGEVGVVAAVAVVPAFRGRGYGTLISRFLVDRILQKGKRPVLISGYDAVAELYRRVGFRETGRWGELYL